MMLKLVAHTPEIETIIATAMLTTTSGSRPSENFRRLSRDPARVAKLVGRLEVQHGSILEHNRFCWILEAAEGEVLNILLKSRFFNFTRLGESRWLLSCNLRTAVEYVQGSRDRFAEILINSIRGVAPTIISSMEA